MNLRHDDQAIPLRSPFQPLEPRCEIPRLRPQRPEEDVLSYARHVVRIATGALDLTFNLFHGCSTAEEMKERLEDYTAATGSLALEQLCDPEDAWCLLEPSSMRDHVSRVIEDARIGQMFKRLRCDCECPYPGEHDCEEGMELEDLSYEVDPEVIDALSVLLRVEDPEQSQFELLMELAGEFERGVEALRAVFGVSDFDLDVSFGAALEMDF